MSLRKQDDATATSFSPEKVLDRLCILQPHLKRIRSMTSNEFESYCNKVEKSGGFDVDGCDGTMPGRICPVSPDSSNWEDATDAAQFAATEYSLTSVRTVEYKQLLKANVEPVGVAMFYLTFSGIYHDERVEKLYKAKVLHKPVKDGMTFELRLFKEVSDSKNIAPKMREEITDILKKKLRTSKRYKPKEIRSQNPTWKYSRVKKVASKKWKSSYPGEKSPYLVLAQYKWSEKKMNEIWRNKGQ